MTSNTNKTPIWFWVIGAMALIWNLLGLWAYFLQMTMSPETLAKLPDVHREMYAATPLWAKFGFAIAVFGGTFGSLLLLLKKRLSIALYAASIVGLIVQYTHLFLLNGAIEKLGSQSAVMPALILTIAIGLLFFSRFSTRRVWVS